MNIIIIGGGKVGYYLAKALIENGHRPTLVEISKKTCKHLANELDIPIICGDGTIISTLEQAGTKDCDSFISITGRDEINLISCQLAKEIFNAKKTVAKVNNPKNKEVIRQLGVDIVINSTDNIVRILEHEVDSARIRQLLTVNQGEASICEVVLSENYKLHGKRLSEIKIPNMCVIISINRKSQTIIPRGDTQLLSGDIVMFMAKNSVINDVKTALKVEEQ